MNEVMRFCNIDMFSSRYIGLFEVLDDVGPVAYRLTLPPTLFWVHPLLHVSIIKRYNGDWGYIIKCSLVLLHKNIAYEEELIVILS